MPEDAERVIALVANKLASDLTVETVVNGLIVEATKVENIGAMYHGEARLLSSVTTTLTSADRVAALFALSSPSRPP